MQYYVHIQNSHSKRIRSRTNIWTLGLIRFHVDNWHMNMTTPIELRTLLYVFFFFLSPHFISYQQEERESCAQFNSFPKCSSFERFTHMESSISIWVLVMFYDFRWKSDNHHWYIFSTSGTTRACIRRLMLVLVMVTMNQAITLLYASRSDTKYAADSFDFDFNFLRLISNEVWKMWEKEWKV